ncbi:MAG: secretin N-terminal domain-containing protein [Thermoguttaceae bacterium]
MKSKANVTESPGLVIYKLNYVNWQIAVEVLKTVLAGDDRLIPDLKTHSLMVVSPPDTQRKVADLLKKVDVPPMAEEPEQQIKIFTLINADPASAAKAISTIGLKGLRVSIDERSRSIIAVGSMETLNIAEALITKLDDPPTTAVRRYDVRVIWLASGLTGEGRGEPPTDDLKDVVAELSRLGIKDPRQVGQMVVQTSSGGSYQGRFEVKSSPRFGDQMADFNASGLLSERPSGPGLVMQIRLRTRKESSPEEQNLNEIDTQIVLPQKQYVVLATAPTGNLTSIFVVQVTEVTKAPEKKGSR